MNNVQHPSSEEFQWYVQYGLRLALRKWPSPRIEVFEEHLNRCDTCAIRLAQEANEELMMQTLAEEGANMARPLMVTWMCATLAVLVLFVVVGVGRASSTPSSVDSMPAEAGLDAGVILADGDLSIEILKP